MQEKKVQLNFKANSEFLYKCNNDTLKLRVTDTPCKVDTMQNKINWSQENSGIEAQTGIFIDINRIWLHPPRSVNYSMLEFCPFPEIRTPLKIGTKWSDSLVIGENYPQKRLTFQGTITFYHNYKITGQINLKTNFGELNCWEVIAVGRSKVGKSMTKLYFHNDFGFVRMSFDSVGDANITLNLIDIKPFQTVIPFEFLPNTIRVCLETIFL